MHISRRKKSSSDQKGYERADIHGVGQKHRKKRSQQLNGRRPQGGEKKLKKKKLHRKRVKDRKNAMPSICSKSAANNASTHESDQTPEAKGAFEKRGAEVRSAGRGSAREMPGSARKRQSKRKATISNEWKLKFSSL